MAPYAWTVIGAGPAGIAAVGRLIDHGVAPERIAWIDPEFAAGDIGVKWRPVSSNTHLALFLDYFNGSAAFRFSEAPPLPLLEIGLHETCALALVAEPLQWITGHLGDRVNVHRTTATALSLTGRRWVIETVEQQLLSRKRHPGSGSGSEEARLPRTERNSVEVALDPEKLAEEPLDGATVAVFGSSHSTMIALPQSLAPSGRESDQLLSQPAAIRRLLR